MVSSVSILMVCDCNFNFFSHCQLSFFRLKDATRQADRMTKSHKSSADSFIKISSCISQMGTSEYMDIDRFLNKVLWLFYYFHLENQVGPQNVKTKVKF